MREPARLFLLLLAAWISFNYPGWGQTAASVGQIMGSVRDAKTGDPVIGAAVQVAASSVGAATDVDGRYLIKNVQPGTYTLVTSYVGYPKTSRQVNVRAGETTAAPFTLQEDEEGRKLNAVQVVGQKRRDTDISMMTELRQAGVVASGISAEQIARTPDRDAAQVVQRVPGVTVMDNRFVVVRGLAQRYNQTMINGVIAPSTEVDTRSFSFDLIPSSVLDRMLIYKSPSAEYPGDFAGGVVTLYTKSVVSENFTSLAVSGGVRSQTTGQDIPYAGRSNTDWLGFDNGRRALPGGLPSILNTADKNYPSQIRQFNNNYNLQRGAAPPDARVNLTLGRRINLSRGVITNLTSLSYTRAYQNIPQSRLERNRYDTALNYIFKYRDQIATTETRLGLIHNWTWQPSARTRYEFRNLFNQLGQDETVVRDGIQPSDRSGNDVYRQYAFRYTQRSIYNGQISGSHSSEDERLSINWTAGGSYLNRSEPDYRRFRQLGQDTGAGAPAYSLIPAASVGSLSETGRFYSKLNEWSIMQSAAVSYRARVFAGDSGLTFKAGYYAEYKQRDFAARFFTYILPSSILATPRGQQLLTLPITDIFASENLAYHEPGQAAFSNGFTLQEGTRPADAYQGRNLYLAPYLSVQETFGPLTANLGLRVEYNRQQLTANATATEKVIVSNPILRPLPSANLSYALTPKALLRFGSGITLNRPEFRELAPFLYYDFQQDANYAGNPGLKTATIYHADLRYEYYPSKGETVSLGIFGKRFVNPIELSNFSEQTTPQYTFLNATSATAAGVEAEVRKSLQNMAVAPWMQRFSFIANASAIYSRVDLGSSSLSRDSHRPLQGQSPYVVNTGVYFTSKNTGWQVSAVYNVSGKRLYAVGNDFFPSIYEMPRHVIDLTLQKRLSRVVELRATIADLLNSQYRFYQDYNRDGQIVRGADQPLIRYQRGTLYTLGIIANL